MDGNTLELIFSCANRNLCDGKIEKDEKEGKPGKIKCFNCNKKLCRFSNLTNTAIIKEKVPTMNIKKDLKKPYPLKLKKSGRKLLAERYYQILRRKYNCLYEIFNSIELPIVSISYPSFNIIGINNKAKKDVKLLRKCVAFVREVKKGNNILNALSKVYSCRNQKYLAEMLFTKSPVYLPNVEIDNNGRKIYYKLMHQPILNSRNKIVGFLIIPIDITQEIEQKNI